jgi:glycosyltransferase involved in cell wall biosynthesis
MLEVIDHVSKREAAEAMSQSDLLLLIATPDLERYMPGKLFDYVASGRPIVVFGSPGEAARTVQQLGIGELCAAGDAQALGDAIGRLHRHEPTPANRAGLAHWLDEHRRSELAQRAFSIIDTVAERT